LQTSLGRPGGVGRGGRNSPSPPRRNYHVDDNKPFPLSEPHESASPSPPPSTSQRTSHAHRPSSPPPQQRQQDNGGGKEWEVGATVIELTQSPPPIKSSTNSSAAVRLSRTSAGTSLSNPISSRSVATSRNSQGGYRMPTSSAGYNHNNNNNNPPEVGLHNKERPSASSNLKYKPAAALMESLEKTNSLDASPPSSLDRLRSTSSNTTAAKTTPRTEAFKPKQQSKSRRVI
jgi:hypothetical protein